LKVKHDKLLSNVAFKCNLRHYMMARALGRAVQVDPGFLQLTQHLLSALETEL